MQIGDLVRHINVKNTRQVGIITARFENNLVKLQVENFTNDILNVRSNIVGLVTTTSGITLPPLLQSLP